MEQDVLLDRVLRPNPPMGPHALLLILVLVSAANLVFAASFLLRGAWPLVPFMGADVALLAWAFRASRMAALREERILMTSSALRIARRPGPRPDIEMNPYWVHLGPERPHGVTLWSHGKGVLVGSFLGSDESISLAGALREALWRARCG